jgi:histone H3/H4
MGDADRLPMANVSRIVQASLPKDSAIAKEARVALSSCATVFVHYVTELAVQQCDKRKKVTLTPEDIIEALREAEFEDFEQPMREALQQFRNGGGASNKKGGSSAKRQKIDESASADTPTRADEGAKDGGGEEDDDPDAGKDDVDEDAAADAGDQAEAEAEDDAAADAAADNEEAKEGEGDE